MIVEAGAGTQALTCNISNATHQPPQTLSFFLFFSFYGPTIFKRKAPRKLTRHAPRRHALQHRGLPPRGPHRAQAPSAA
eukprot:scaffold1735_cov119-Isochrysis_galbana.AAC.9